MTSVVIPVLDGLHILPTIVPAVLAMHGVDEVVWVDDGSNDGTSGWLDAALDGHPTARVLHLDTNRGRAAARNAGAAAVSGDILVFLDADVEPTPETARALTDAASGRGAVAAVARLDHVVDNPDDPFQDYVANHPRGPSPGTPGGGTIDWRFFLSGACAVRHEAFAEVGGFDSSIAYGEDVALGCDLKRVYPNGLRLADSTVRLHDLGDLDGALDHAAALGRNLTTLQTRCPGFAPKPMGTDRIAWLAKPLLQIAIKVLGSGKNRRKAVRYLLGATVLHASRRA